MSLVNFLNGVLQFLIVVPSAVFCYLPMGHQLKYSVRVTALRISLFLCLYLSAAGALYVLCGRNTNLILIPSLPILFILYRSTIKADIARSLAIFILACALVSYPSIFSFLFDGRLHPNDTWLEYSMEANLFQMFFSVVLLLILIYPLSRQAARLVDRLTIPGVWYLTIPVSAVFLIVNLLFIPHNYQSLHQNRLFPMAVCIITALLLLYLMLCALFYRIAMGIIENMRLEQKAQLLELQENQYTAMSRHIAETQRLRHDFRHQLRTFQKLAEQEDFQTLSSLLEQYSQSISDSGFQFFCQNPALNALLNYYAQEARSRGITLQWKLELPETLPFPEIDLCSLLGNLIENALDGCQTVSGDSEPYHCLSVAVQNKRWLCIVSTNRFDGQVKQKNGQYLSTKKGGHGTGLLSVTAIAEKYGGVARFHHTDTEFCADVMLQL